MAKVKGEENVKPETAMVAVAAPPPEAERVLPVSVRFVPMTSGWTRLFPSKKRTELAVVEASLRKAAIVVVALKVCAVLQMTEDAAVT